MFHENTSCICYIKKIWFSPAVNQHLRVAQSLGCEEAFSDQLAGNNWISSTQPLLLDNLGFAKLKCQAYFSYVFTRMENNCYHTIRNKTKKFVHLFYKKLLSNLTKAIKICKIVIVKVNKICALLGVDQLLGVYQH